MLSGPEVVVREPEVSEQPWVADQLRAWWGSTTVVNHQGSLDAARLPALLALRGDRRVGLATLEYRAGDCHLVTLNALEKSSGVGSALLAAVVQRAAARGCRRVWLTTTNDNVDALRFYQRRGMRLVAIHRNTMDEARRIKSSIPAIGEYGIPIHDELELELRLQ